MDHLVRTHPGGILLTLGDEVPQLLAHKCGKQATGVSGGDGPRPLGGAEEPEPVALAVLNQPLPLGLPEQFRQPQRIREIGWLKTAERWLALLSCFFANTSLRPASGGFWVFRSRREFLVVSKGWKTALLIS